jgi:hypothetical protein
LHLGDPPKRLGAGTEAHSASEENDQFLDHRAFPHSQFPPRSSLLFVQINNINPSFLGDFAGIRESIRSNGRDIHGQEDRHRCVDKNAEISILRNSEPDSKEIDERDSQ